MLPFYKHQQLKQLRNCNGNLNLSGSYRIVTIIVYTIQATTTQLPIGCIMLSG